MNKLSNQLMEKKRKKKKVLVWSSVIGIAIIIVAFIVLEINCPRKQFLSKVFVSEAKVTQKAIDDDNSPAIKYVKVSLVNPSERGVSIKDDYTWVAVNDEYYSKHNVGDSIGVLVGNYDIYRENYFGLFKNSGQYMEANVWGIENIFDSIDIANETYPKKSFHDNAQLKTKANEKENYFFVLTYDEREMTVEVSNEQYNTYKENDLVECMFEGYGEFIKITEIV